MPWWLLVLMLLAWACLLLTQLLSLQVRAMAAAIIKILTRWMEQQLDPTARAHAQVIAALEDIVRDTMSDNEVPARRTPPDQESLSPGGPAMSRRSTLSTPRSLSTSSQGQQGVGYSLNAACLLPPTASGLAGT